MIRADIKRAAERLYREAAGEMREPEIDVAMRDGAPRRDFERVVARTLVAEPDALVDVAESVLSGTVEGSDGAEWHADVLAAFLRDRRRRVPTPLDAFLKLAGRPSRWGDAYAGATLGGPDGFPALFRILVQVELAPNAVAVGKDGAPRVRVEMDRSFGRDASRDPRQRQRVEDAVGAAFDYIRHIAPGRPVRDVERAKVVRVFRGGLPWPLSRDSTLPTIFELEQDEQDHTGPSMGLPIAMAVLHAFLPHWTTVEGPLCAATGHVTRTGSVEAVGNVEDKAEAAARADLPFLFPRRGAARGVQERFRHTAVDTLAAAAAAAFNLAGDDVDGFLAKSPTVLFGREDQRDIPVRAWQLAKGGEPRLVLVHGPSGIGKSGLVARSMRELMEAGAPVVFTRAGPNESLAFDPIADRLVAGLATKELRLHSQEHGPWLASSVEALEIFLPQHFKRAPGDTAGQAVERKVRAIRALVQTCALRHGGLVLVIDDVQWGKEETWPVLRQLLDPARAAPVLVVATYRRDADGVSPEAEVSLAGLRAAGVVEDVELAGLSPDAIRRWVSSVLPSLPFPAGELAAALEEVAAGNPLHIGNHLGKLAEVLVDNPTLDADEVLATVGRVGLDVLSERLRNHPSLNTLKLAATVRTTEFSLQLLQEASSVDGKALLHDIEGAQAARFIAPAGPHRFTFVHESTRDLVRALITPDETADLNLDLAKALERRATQYEGARVPSADLAQHYAEAGPVAGGAAWEKAWQYAVRAAEDNTGAWPTKRCWRSASSP